MRNYSKAPRKKSVYETNVEPGKDIAEEKKYIRLTEWPQLREISLDITKLQCIFAESDPKKAAKVDGKAEINEKSWKDRSLLWLDIGTKRDKYRSICGLNYMTYPSLDAKVPEKKVQTSSF